MHTPRLLLRPFRYGDVKDVFDLCSCAETSKFSLWEPHESLWDSIKYIFFVKHKSVGIHWSVRDAASDEMIGSCSFVTIDWENGIGEIGYSVNPRFWRRRYGSETADALLKLGFGKMGLKRIAVRIMAENIPSLEMARSLGMREVESEEKFVVYNGRKRDIVRLEISAEEYAAKID